MTVARPPDPELEALGRCPVCRTPGRTCLYRGLQDSLFQTTAERWSLFRCAECGLLYLDPRPKEDSIGRHYAVYYTHESAAESNAVPGSAPAGFMQTCIEDWLHRHYGIGSPARRPGRSWMLAPFPGLRRSLACTHRHLRPPHDGAKLLDVGCGNGSFLPLAQRMGWDAHGLESDPAAVAAAQRRGLPVRQGGFPMIDWPGDSFAAVTLNHVVEHLHDPVATFREIHRILKPGGWVWVSTPNADSYSHRTFGRHWRGLEPPRHLNIFTPRSLRLAAQGAGFGSCRWLPPKWMAQWYAQISAEIAAATGAPVPRPGRLNLAWANFRTLFRRGAGEELYFIARK